MTQLQMYIHIRYTHSGKFGGDKGAKYQLF